MKTGPKEPPSQGGSGEGDGGNRTWWMGTPGLDVVLPWDEIAPRPPYGSPWTGKADDGGGSCCYGGARVAAIWWSGCYG